eukprot:TRINITY_DN19515_c0_g2_i1.p1 TRINITY_DN19515_c0_g2~~TRINITY_DN19515_c0_g2_i1.p1  ORF type:complete len:577 (+),score=38.66 TRINITY_DN19515_c0_g2_i1:73-1803(+)
MTSQCAVCDEVASKICGKCRRVYYCSAAHQRLHWKTHKARCLPASSSRDSVNGWREFAPAILRGLDEAVNGIMVPTGVCKHEAGEEHCDKVEGEENRHNSFCVYLFNNADKLAACFFAAEAAKIAGACKACLGEGHRLMQTTSGDVSRTVLFGTRRLIALSAQDGGEILQSDDLGNGGRIACMAVNSQLKRLVTLVMMPNTPMTCISIWPVAQPSRPVWSKTLDDSSLGLLVSSSRRVVYVWMVRGVMAVNVETCEVAWHVNLCNADDYANHALIRCAQLSDQESYVIAGVETSHRTSEVRAWNVANGDLAWCVSASIESGALAISHTCCADSLGVAAAGIKGKARMVRVWYRDLGTTWDCKVPGVLGDIGCVKIFGNALFSGSRYGDVGRHCQGLASLLSLDQQAVLWQTDVDACPQHVAILSGKLFFTSGGFIHMGKVIYVVDFMKGALLYTLRACPECKMKMIGQLSISCMSISKLFNVVICGTQGGIGCGQDKLKGGLVAWCLKKFVQKWTLDVGGHVKQILCVDGRVLVRAQATVENHKHVVLASVCIATGRLHWRNSYESLCELQSLDVA